MAAPRKVPISTRIDPAMANALDEYAACVRAMTPGGVEVSRSAAVRMVLSEWLVAREAARGESR